MFLAGLSRTGKLLDLQIIETSEQFIENFSTDTKNYNFSKLNNY